MRLEEVNWLEPVSRIGIEPARAWADVDRLTSVPMITTGRSISDSQSVTTTPLIVTNIMLQPGG
jgi:hypothetical protein